MSSNISTSFWEKNLQVWRAGLGSQSSAEPLGFCVRVFQQVFYYANGSAEPSCRTPKALQNSGEGFGAGPSFEDWPFFLPISPQRFLKWGTGKWGREIRGFWNFHTTPRSGNSGKLILGTSFWWLGGMRRAKVDVYWAGVRKTALIRAEENSMAMPADSLCEASQGVLVLEIVARMFRKCRWELLDCWRRFECFRGCFVAISRHFLLAQPLDPPLSRYRVSLYLSHLCFSGYRRVSRYTPPYSPYRSRREGVAGGIAAQAALWRVSRYTGVSLR